MQPITAARLRCIGLGLYCIALAVAGFVPAFVAMVCGKLLIAFGDLWAGECDRAMARCDEAKAMLVDLEMTRRAGG